MSVSLRAPLYPALRDAAAVTNLERSEGELYGRDEALDALIALCDRGLAGPLTLVGPPGVGKSRLLEALGWRLLDSARASEVWWINLRELTDSAQIQQTIAALLGVPAGPEPLMQRVGAAIGGRGALWLLFDNAEHLLAPCAEVIEALREAGCDGRLVVTSREALGSLAEHVTSLDALPTPDPAAPPAQLMAHPAIALLLAHTGAGRTARVRPAPSVEELGACARLVQRFDGLPLALTLIGPRLRLVKPQALLAQLDANSASQRLPALDAALALSWDLLSTEERAALARCAVCADGFTLELARAVVGDQLDAPLDATLRRLEQRSLLVWSEARGRWSMLLSVQRYAQSQLDALTRRDAQERHAQAMAALGHALVEACSGSAWHPSVARASAERANLAAAVSWARSRGALELWLGCALGLGLLLYRGGEPRLQTELEPLVRAVDEAGDAVPAYERVLLWRLVLDVEGVQWSMELARPLLQRALELAHELPRPLLVTLLWHQIDAALEAGDAEEVASRAAQVDQALEDTEDAYLHARQRFVRGQAAMNLGLFEQARAAFDEAVARWPPDEHPYELGRLRLYRSFASQFLCDAERALEDMGAARALFAQVGDRTSQAHALRVLANYCVDEGRAEQARDAVEALMMLGRRHGLSWAWGWAHLLMGQLELDMGRLGEGVEQLEQAARQFVLIGQAPFEVGACALGALGLWLAGADEAASARLALALERRAAVRSPWGQLQLDCLEVSRLASRGEVAQAAALMEAVAARTHGESPLAQPLVALGQSFVALARWDEALRKGFHSAALRERRALLELLGRVEREHGRELGMSVELRLTRRLLLSRLPAALGGARLRAELDDAAGEALLVDEARPGYRAPGMARWEELDGHAMTSALLAQLVNQRRERPGAPLSTEALIERLWPGEGLEVAQRLYVLIGALRRDGMRDVIQHVAGGYMCDPDVHIIVINEHDLR